MLLNVTVLSVLVLLALLFPEGSCTTAAEIPGEIVPEPVAAIDTVQVILSDVVKLETD